MQQTNEQILSIISSRRKLSNCYFFYDEIASWFDSKRAEFYLIDGCVFIFYKINGFYKFYYYVDKFDDINLARELLNKYSLNSTVSLEFTTKNDKFLPQISQAAIACGFEFYARYVRLVYKNEIGSVITDKTKEHLRSFDIATKADIDELLEIIHNEFDVVKDDLPERDELIRLLERGCVLVRRYDGKISYIQIYEYSKNTLYSKMTWIKKEYRKPKHSVEFYSANVEFANSIIKKYHTGGGVFASIAG